MYRLNDMMNKFVSKLEWAGSGQRWKNHRHVIIEAGWYIILFSVFAPVSISVGVQQFP